MNPFRVSFVSAKIAPLVLFLCLSFGLHPVSGMAKEKWDPIPPEDLAATDCQAYPGSSAEILFDRQVLDSSGNTQTQSFYRRIKIYSSKGANEAGVLSIEYPNAHKVWGLAAKVTKPDGAVAEYTREEFTESVSAKYGSTKINQLTLAVPDLGTGDVLELIWTQTVDSKENYYQWWYCQRPLPVREFIFSVESSTTDFNLWWFNVADAKIISNRRQEAKLVIKNLPPFEDEPNLPPTRDVRGWFLMLYTNPYMRWYDKKDEFWKELSSYLGEEFRLKIKPNSAIKVKAAELTQGANSDEEKLKALYDFCQAHVTNFDYFDSAELQVAKKKLDNKDRDQSPAQTLTLTTGYTEHVNELFASLVKALGYTVQMARSASRYDTFNVRHQNGWLFLKDQVVVIRLGEAWHYYAPGDYYVPAGMLHRSDEMAPSLICDEKKVIFEANPVSIAEKSPMHRKGRFSLDAEGNLEGDVEISMSGHAGSSRKQDWAKKQNDEIDSDFRESITKQLPAAEVNDLQWENLKGNALPLIARYKIKVPGYADLAGTKIVLAPNVFEHGSTAMFTAEKRKYSIFFSNAWIEQDDIEILLPEGYTLDAGSAPANVGDIKGAVGVRYHVGYNPKSNKIVFKRDFVVGGNGAIAFQADSYPVLKKLFDQINRSDEHTLLLKQVATVAVPVAAGNIQQPAQ